ncbi:outer membrane beta-barrel protein [Rhodoblastus acidophilus]|uniref:Outer membrane beta-barrel protein n=1 Tax=Candidatus Rhodoblastus alkanivorans TaxID=2954117 RepID=A0ABS9ZBH5_9HYPH|nr:OmpW family outer membrane protein [Candidatus Rhodoblastus alkanivorans]MCI4679114.1 outer membrane beta-barrel protein [Candidatus Rhodoblastus alkanivorans]MCI4684998.1 outer membrane beta-barrel protein [Candidatus Rhodoblastus alkanivorans]
MTFIRRGAIAAILFGSIALPALAADLPSGGQAPVFTPVADTFDPFMIRVRGLGVLPQGQGTSVSGAGPISGTLAGASLSNNLVPEGDVTYFITQHWAVEGVVAGLIHARLTSNAFGTAAIANTTLLPPTFTLQYHFALGPIDPYVGAGVNYTWFLWTKSSVLPSNSVNIHPSAGLALDAGFDYYLTKHWALNVDVKKVFLETAANTPFGVNSVHLNANPWLIAFGVGYRFGGGGGETPVVAKY